MLDASPNPFGGIVTNPTALPDNPNEFRTRLTQALDEWRDKQYKVVWMEFPLANAALIPAAVEAGFEFHHADGGYAMLTLQLEENAHIPPYATHYIGAGGVVINESREILVVSEKHRRSAAPAYKLPGGALHPGEHLAEGVVREVLEETGVHTKFESLGCFRHWHGYRYGKSDIYFVCLLSPLSNEITMQEEELDDCLWMPVDDYLSSDETSSFNKTIINAALAGPGISPGVMEGYGEPDRYEFFLPSDGDSTNQIRR